MAHLGNEGAGRISSVSLTEGGLERAIALDDLDPAGLDRGQEQQRGEGKDRFHPAHDTG